MSPCQLSPHNSIISMNFDMYLIGSIFFVIKTAIYFLLKCDIRIPIASGLYSMSEIKLFPNFEFFFRIDIRLYNLD